ncbi:MAG: hypothetical protein V1875_01260 [Candidatus Altiarchaeota archaeon]
MSGRGRRFALAIALSALFPCSVNAYIDPGAGSMFVQLLLAGLMAAWFVTRTRLERVFRAVTSLARRGKDA